jgi:hypothetical protein
MAMSTELRPNADGFVLLTKGKLYRGRLVLPWYASNGRARTALEDAGFYNVDVRLSTEKVGEAFAYGTWGLDTQWVRLPKQVKDGILWED